MCYIYHLKSSRSCLFDIPSNITKVMRKVLHNFFCPLCTSVRSNFPFGKQIFNISQSGNVSRSGNVLAFPNREMFPNQEMFFVHFPFGKCFLFQSYDGCESPLKELSCQSESLVHRLSVDTKHK